MPEGTYPEVGAKIMDVQEPTSRMSTSAATDAGVLACSIRPTSPPQDPLGRHRLGADVVRSPEKPGVTNLIEILAAATGEAPEAIEARTTPGLRRVQGRRRGGGRRAVAPIQARYAELRSDPGELRALLAKGAGKASAIASRTLRWPTRGSASSRPSPKQP